MPQTRFVLKKSLELGLKPIVVINKIDKPAADPKVAEDQVLELFFDLGANEEQLDFPVIYVIARDGVAKNALQDEGKDLTPLLDLIIEKVPPADSQVESHIIVYGDSEFVSNRYLDYLGNRDLLINSVDWLAKEDRLIAPRAKDKKPGINIFFVTAAQQKTLFLWAVIIQPGFFLLIGIVVFGWRRWSS